MMPLAQLTKKIYEKINHLTIQQFITRGNQFTTHKKKIHVQMANKKLENMDGWYFSQYCALVHSLQCYIPHFRILRDRSRVSTQLAARSFFLFFFV